MITHFLAADMCRRAAARIRELAEAAYPGPWISDDSDQCWRLHSAPDPHFPTAQILKAPKNGTPYAEYWPDEATGAHITSWSPPPASAVADFLMLAADEIEALSLREPAAPVPALLMAAARIGEAFLLAQPKVPDSSERLEALLSEARAAQIAVCNAGDGAP